MTVKKNQRSRARTRTGKYASASRKTSDRIPRLKASLQHTLDQLAESANQALATNPGARIDPQKDRNNLFKQAVYRGVWMLFESGRENEIKKIVEHGAGQPKSISFERNPYYWALYALSTSDSLDEKLSLSALNNVGWQLLHAHRHRILPELLIGFLYQTAASSSIKQKLIKAPGSTYHEPWLGQYMRQVRSALPPRIQVSVGA